jgi:hypothetical protein
MFDPVAFVTVATVAAAGTGAAVTLAAAAGIMIYRPGTGRRRRQRIRQ